MKAFNKAIATGLKAAIATAGIFICTSAIGIANVPVVPFERERSAISKDVANIHADRNYIAFLKSRCKENKKAGNSMAVIENKRKLAEAEADLERNKEYLAAHKKELARSHKEAIKNCKEFVKEDRENLSDARWERFKNRYIHGNEAAARKNEIAVIKYKEERDKHKAGLENEKVFRNTDMIAVNKKIDKADGQMAIVTSTEIAYARTENWAMGR